MNLFKMMFTLFIAVMKSERGSVGAETSGIEKYMDDANLESLGAGSSTESDDAGDGQPSGEPGDAGAAEMNGDGKPTLEDQLAEFGKDADNEGNEGGSGLLDQLNALGILRNGMPVEFDDIEKAKEMLSKGFDYTQKTQELSQQRKEQEDAFAQEREAFSQEREEFESYREQLNDQILENQVMGQILMELKNNDPDIFNEIKSSYDQRMSVFNMQNNHPAFKQYGQQISELKKQLAETSKTKQHQEAQETVKGWETGLSEVQSEFGLKLRKMGVKPNWEKVKQVWLGDSSNSTTVRQALLSVHGDQMMKAMEAYTKLNKTKAQSAQRMGPTGDNKATSQTPSQHGNGTYLKDLEAIAAKHGI